jgi:SAM-dependent methyltransferase
MSIVDHSSTRSTIAAPRGDRRKDRARAALSSKPADRLERLLCCPCGGSLVGFEDHASVVFTCANCGQEGRRTDNQFIFGGFATSELKEDWLNRVKEFAKRKLGRFYRQAIDVISPMYAPPLIRPWLKTFDANNDLVADFGCGPIVYAPDVLCVDGANYPNVHLVADLERLPIRGDSLSGVISFGVLEHVPNPQSHVAEIRRVLKPGGRVLCFIPFIQGFHASPYDYQRYTAPGMRELFRDFEVLDVRVASGPTSGMLWVLQEWLALLFSFGSMRLYRLLAPLMWLLSPLKYLDILLSRHPAAGVICSGFVFEGRKRDA